MKVYVVSRGCRYEGSYVEAVFSSREAAEAAYGLESGQEIKWGVGDEDDRYITVTEHEIKESAQRG